MTSVSLVVPVWNEATRLKQTGEVLAAFVAQFPGGELVIADDGSSDDSAVIASDLGATVVKGDHRGKGAALRAGISAAKGDVVAFCDVDIATSLDDLARIINEATTTDAIVIGSRAVRSSSFSERESFVRENLGRAFNKVVQALLVRGVRDTQCGAKAATKNIWASLLSASAEDGFAWDVEVLARARRLAIPIIELGVHWSHQPGSRVRVGADGLAMLRAVPRIWWRQRSSRA